MNWYSFECSDPNCPASAMNGGTGVITEVRLPEGFSKPTAFCPLCASQMHFRDHWPASESGHGSHACFDLQQQYDAQFDDFLKLLYEKSPPEGL